MDIRHHHVTVNGHTMHYAACGDADQPVMVFVHGFPECWLAWREQIATFGRYYLAVAPDTRGINASSGPEDASGYRARHLVADIEALLDHLGAQRCVLVGHDWGGAIACAFALAHPDRLHGLVMINAVHPAIFDRELKHNPAQQAASAYMTMFRSVDAESVVRQDDFAYLTGMFAQDGSPPTWFDERLQSAYHAAWSRPGSVHAGLSYYRASPLHPNRPSDDGATALPVDTAMTVRVPTLVIWGEQDRFLLPGCLDGLEHYIPDLRVERIPDGSHWVVHEYGPTVGRLITEFLNERVDVP